MRPATPKPRLRVKSGVIFHKIAAKSVLCGAVKYKTELANHVLTVGLFAVKSINGAKHVAPAVADRRTGVQLPPPPPIEEGELISVHFSMPAPRAAGLMWQGFTDFVPFLISDYPRQIFSELPNTLCTSPYLSAPKSMTREQKTL